MRSYSAYPGSSYNTYNNSESQNNINNIFTWFWKFKRQ